MRWGYNVRFFNGYIGLAISRIIWEWRSLNELEEKLIDCGLRILAFKGHMNVIDQHKVLLFITIRYFFPYQLVDLHDISFLIALNNKSTVRYFKIAYLFQKRRLATLSTHQQYRNAVFNHLDHHGIELGVFNCWYPKWPELLFGVLLWAELFFKVLPEDPFVLFVEEIVFDGVGNIVWAAKSLLNVVFERFSVLLRAVADPQWPVRGKNHAVEDVVFGVEFR